MTRAVVFSCDLSMNGVVFLTFFFLFLTHPIGHIVQPPGGERDVKVAREQRTQQHFFSSLKQKSCLNLLHHRDLLKKIQFLLFLKKWPFFDPLNRRPTEPRMSNKYASSCRKKE